MQKYYVYEWIRLDTLEPFYVGKGSKERWCNTYDSRTKEFRDIALNVPCAINFIVDEVDENMAFLVERLIIESYMFDSPYELVNIAQGGSGRRGAGFSQETRDKISKSKKGVKFDDEHKSKISIALKEYRKNNPNHPTTKGRKATPEQLKRQSEAMKGKLAGAKHPCAKTFTVSYLGETKEYTCYETLWEDCFSEAPFNTVRQKIKQRMNNKVLPKGRGEISQKQNIMLNLMEMKEITH